MNHGRIKIDEVQISTVGSTIESTKAAFSRTTEAFRALNKSENTDGGTSKVCPSTVIVMR